MRLKAGFGTYFRVFIFFFLFSFPVFAERLLSGTETQITVVPTTQNYYLATLTRECESYNPTYFDDYHLCLNDIPILHFTMENKEIMDYYFYLTDRQDIDYALSVLTQGLEQVTPFFQPLLSSLNRYKTIRPGFEEKDVHNTLEQQIKEWTSTTLFRVVGESPDLVKIDKALFRYLVSNGIEHLEEIRKNQPLLDMLVNKFYMLSTTYFYRDWTYVKAFKKQLPLLKEKILKENRPFKVHVFACSTGEEVLTYAIELLESGIENFKILASDINTSSLRFAERMTYGASSFDRLTFESQAKLKKYFKRNPLLHVWELKDPEFFKSRIRFIPYNILESLPSDLDSDFAPPYDLLSVMNVLLYLEDNAVQTKKEAWADMVALEGIWVLHDAKYNLARGHLNASWTFDRFLCLNEWVNVRIHRNFSMADKIKFYKDLYSSSNEISFYTLATAYFLSEQYDKAIGLCNDYLERNPISFIGLFFLIKAHLELDHTYKAGDLLEQMFYSHIHQMGTLEYLIEFNRGTPEESFLKEIQLAYKKFLISYRNQPELLETIFDFKKPSTKKYQAFRPVFKAIALAMTQSALLELQQEADIKSLSRRTLNQIRLIRELYPEYVVIFRFLTTLLSEIIEYHIHRQQYDKALEYCNTGFELLEGREDKNFQATFFTLEGLGMIYLNKARILELKGASDDGFSYLNKAIDFLNQSQGLIQDLPSVKYYLFYNRMGKAYFLRAKQYLKHGDKGKASKDIQEAFLMFEKALELNPLYGKEPAANRGELIKFAEKSGIRIEGV